LNRLAVMRTLALLRREPFPISSVAVPREAGDGSGEFQPRRPPEAQVPRTERRSTLRRSITYATIRREGKSRTLKVDVHVPSAHGKFPLVVYLPGGGFVVAPRQMARAQRGFVADAGFVVASVTYRTVNDDATFREGLADVCAAIAYLVDNADDYRIAPGGVALWGESAGGYLAALAATTCAPAAPVKAVVTIVGATDVSQISDGFDDAAAKAWLAPTSPLVRYVGNPPPPEANPVAYVGPSTPPFLVLHGEDDRIVSPRQTLLLHRTLVAAGVRSRRVVFGEASHGMLGFRRNDNRVWTSVRVMSSIVGFLCENLLGTP
jgi:acetyl esterase/lipase